MKQYYDEEFWKRLQEKQLAKQPNVQVSADQIKRQEVPREERGQVDLSRVPDLSEIRDILLDPRNLPPYKSPNAPTQEEEVAAAPAPGGVPRYAKLNGTDGPPVVIMPDGSPAMADTIPVPPGANDGAAAPAPGGVPRYAKLNGTDGPPVVIMPDGSPVMADTIPVPPGTNDGAGASASALLRGDKTNALRQTKDGSGRPASGRPTYADAISEWEATGRPMLDVLQELFPAPEPEMTPEEAKRLQAAAALGDSLKILAEIYGDSQNATIRNRYGEQTEYDKAQARADAANAKYQELLRAHRQLMGSAAMDEIGRIYAGQLSDYEREEQAKAAAAEAAQKAALARQKAEQDREIYRDKRNIDLEYAGKKYAYIDRPKAAQAQKDKIDLEGVKNKYRLGEIAASGAEARKTKQTPYAFGGGSDSTKSGGGKYVTRRDDGKLSIRLEERETPWRLSDGTEVRDPEMKQQGNTTKRTRDVVMTQEEYDYHRQKAMESYEKINNPLADPNGLSEAEVVFRDKVLGTPEKSQKDIDYLTKIWLEAQYQTGDFAAPDELVEDRIPTEAATEAIEDWGAGL